MNVAKAALNSILMKAKKVNEEEEEEEGEIK